jgi:hypothetical protein
MFVFVSWVSEDGDQLAERIRTVTTDLCEHAVISPGPRFEVKELGEIRYGINGACDASPGRGARVMAYWLELADRGPGLVPCLDFPGGGRAAAGFADLAAGVPAGVCFLHVRQPGRDPGGLGAQAGRWAAELAGTGRPVRAVLGYCAGTALATRLADAITDATGAPPLVVLLDAVPATGESLTGQFTAAVESNARHLTAAELDAACSLAGDLAQDCPEDLAGIAGVLAGRYEQLMGAVAGRLSLSGFLRQELTTAFTAYMDYLLLASEGTLTTGTGVPVFVCSDGFEPPAQAARVITAGCGHDDLLRDPLVCKLVADLLTGEHPW